MKTYQNKNWLNQKYWIEGLSQPEIAKLCDVANSIIWYWMKKLKINRRSKSECKLAERNPMWGKRPNEKTREKLRLSHINTPKGKNHFNWKGGQIMHEGYIFVLMPGHPKANSNKGYVKRARLVAEKKLGRYLYPGEIPHHKNEIKDDDRPENIQVMESISEHVKHHRNLKT